MRWYWVVYGTIFLAILMTVLGLLWYQVEVVGKIEREWKVTQESRSPVGAVWMEHAWVDPGRSEKEVLSMTKRLQSLGITDAFVHSGPLEANGSLSSAKYAETQDLLRQMHGVYPDIRVQAWIGQVTTTWGGPLDLTAESVRDNIVRSARDLLEEGFDGIHLNLEPVLDGDMDFLDLLQDLRLLTEEYKATLSLASDDVEPFLGAGFLVRSCCREVTFWKPAYLAKVFGFVDQVAVMTYDSSLQEDIFYSWYVSLVTERLSEITPEGKTLFIGLPSFETGNAEFNTEVENITSGLKGVVAGLAKVTDLEAVSRLGVAIYAYWETSEEEWQVYREYWQGQ